MEDRIRHTERSVRVNVGDDSYLYDPHYDTIHTFRWLGHSILKIVTEDGLAQIHCHESYGDYIAEQTESEIFERRKIGAREREMYLRYQEQTLEQWDER